MAGDQCPAYVEILDKRLDVCGFQQKRLWGWQAERQEPWKLGRGWRKVDRTWKQGGGKVEKQQISSIYSFLVNGY